MSEKRRVPNGIVCVTNSDVEVARADCIDSFAIIWRNLPGHGEIWKEGLRKVV